MFYLPTLCGLEYHMSLGAIDSHDLCVNTVPARQLYVSYYINLLGAMLSRCSYVTLCVQSFTCLIYLTLCGLGYHVSVMLTFACLIYYPSGG